mgnify:CR=1 FL=1
MIHSHHRVCEKNKKKSFVRPWGGGSFERRSSNNSANSNNENKSKIEHPPMRFANERPKENQGYYPLLNPHLNQVRPSRTFVNRIQQE